MRAMSGLGAAVLGCCTVLTVMTAPAAAADGVAGS